MKLSLVLPTRNEAAIILDSLRTIAAACGPELSSRTEVLIADDGSDELPTIVAKESLPFHSVTVLRNSPPLGKGRALAAAFQLAQGDLCGFLDADLSTPPRFIPEAIALLESGGYDLVIGSRREDGSSVQRKQHPVKTFLGNLLPWFSSGLLFLGRDKFSDTQCGFKFFGPGLAQSLYRGLLIADGMADIEVLLRATERRYRVKQLAITWKDERESKRPLRRTLLPDLKALFTLLVRYRLASKHRFPVESERMENA